MRILLSLLFSLFIVSFSFPVQAAVIEGTETCVKGANGKPGPDGKPAGGKWFGEKKTPATNGEEGEAGGPGAACTITITEAMAVEKILLKVNVSGGKGGRGGYGQGRGAHNGPGGPGGPGGTIAINTGNMVEAGQISFKPTCPVMGGRGGGGYGERKNGATGHILVDGTDVTSAYCP